MYSKFDGGWTKERGTTRSTHEFRYVTRSKHSWWYVAPFEYVSIKEPTDSSHFAFCTLIRTDERVHVVVGPMTWGTFFSHDIQGSALICHLVPSLFVHFGHQKTVKPAIVLAFQKHWRFKAVLWEESSIRSCRNFQPASVLPPLH